MYVDKINRIKEILINFLEIPVGFNYNNDTIYHMPLI